MYINMDIENSAKTAIEQPEISIIIPTFNYAKNIGNCLQPLVNQVSKVNYEIIMIDTSTDGTDLVVKEKFPQVKLFHYNERKFVGEARNAGVKKAKGKFILFIDQDCVASPNWIERMHKIFETTKADGVGGSLENGTPLSVTGTAGYYLEFFRFLPKRKVLSKSTFMTNSFLVGANCGFKREIFDSFKYYDNYDKKKIGEDFYFCWQLTKNSKKLVYEPSVSVKHINKTGFTTFFQYQNKIGKSACAYRNQVRDRVMTALLKIPVLSFFIPMIIIPRIGLCILQRLGIAEFFKFFVLLPLLILGNYTWAIGFFNELKRIRAIASASTSRR